MSVDVSGGTLEWKAALDTSDFDKSVDSLGDKLSAPLKSATADSNALSQSLLQTAKSSQVALNPKSVQEWSDAINKAGANISGIISKSSNLIDPAKLQALNSEIHGTDSTFKQLSETINFIKENIGSLKLNPDDSKSLAESIKVIENSFDGFTEQTVKATTQIRNLKNEMSTMEQKGGPQFQALQVEAARLQKEVDESNNSVRLLASDTAGLQAGVGVLRGVVGGFEAIAGAVGLASGKSEDMERVISSIIAAMGVLNGIQEVAEVINKRSALNQYLLLQYRKATATVTTEAAASTELLAGATASETVATEGAAVAQAELNTVMGLNPALALLAGISALAAGIYFLTQKSHEADEAATRLNKTLLDQYKVSQEIFELSKFSANQNIAAQEANLEVLRASNASQKDQLGLQIKIDNLKQDQAAKDLQKAKDDLTGAGNLTKSLNDSIAQMQKLQGLNVKPLDLGFQNTTDVDTLTKKLEILDNRIAALKNSSRADKDKSLIEKLTSQADLLRPKITAYIDAVTKQQTAASKTIVDNTTQTTQAYNDDVKSFTAAQDSKTLALGKSSAAQLELTLNSIKAQAEASLNPKLNPNLTTGEIEKIKADSLKKQADAVFQFNQKEYADTVKLLNSEAALYKEGTKQRLDLELQALNVSRIAQQQQLIQLNGQSVQYRKLSADQQAAINNETNAQVAEKNKNFFKQSTEDQLNIQIALDKAKLASVTAGSAEELALKKDLLDQEAQLEIVGAKNSISNQELLSAKLVEINAVTIGAKQKLDDEYVQHTLDNTLKLIKAVGERSKQSNNDILGDPNSTLKEKTQAQLDNLNIDANTIREEQQAVENAILEVIRTGNGDIVALIDERRKLAAELNAVNNKLAEKPKIDAAAQTASTLEHVGSELTRLGSNLGQYDQSLGAVITSLGTIAKSAASLEKIFDKVNVQTTSQNIASGLEAVISLISSVISASAARAEAEATFNAELLNQQLSYNVALNDAILLNTKLKDNVFVTNFQGQLKDGIASLADAQKNYAKSLAALANGQVKEGKRTVVSGSAILSGIGQGAVFGAAIGSAIPVIGTTIGAVVGGIVGGIVGLFGGKKDVDKYVNLLKEYPELLRKGANGQTEINKELAQSLISNDLLDAQTKVLVQNTLDWQAAMDKANDQIKSIISDLAGSLGSDLSDSLVKAFEDGTDAANAFAGSVQKTLENVLKQMLFNDTFGKAFDELQKKMQDSFQAGGDFNWQDDLETFFQQYAGLSQQFDDALTAAQKEAAAAGLSIFQSSSATQQANGLSGAIKGITEQQADLLAGQFGGLRLTAIDQLKVAQNSFTALNEIVYNTSLILDVKNTLNFFKLNGIKVQ